MSTNNKVILHGCIEKFKEENSISAENNQLFELFSLTQITKHSNFTHENLADSIVDGGSDGGIDSLLISINDEAVGSMEDLEDLVLSNKSVTKIILTQCKSEGSFKEGALDKLLSSCTIIFDLDKTQKDLEIRFNDSLLEKILILRDVWLKTSINGGSLEVSLNYCCLAPFIEANDAFFSKVTQLEDLIKQKCAISAVRFTCFSSDELLKLYQTKRQLRLALKFKDQPLSTTFNASGIGYVGTIGLGEYKKFLSDESGEIRDYLFESNIRHFQGAVEINKKIADTIANDKNTDFWWLNNGITIIADNPNQAGKLLSLDNVQIVNGLQTSYSIFKSYDGDLEDDRSVLVKVIINTEIDQIDKIIESTNSQNAVSPTVLRANDEAQRKIELFFENEGYFYDRRKNYYKNLAKPSAKIFSIQFAAQSIETIIFNSPHTARSKPTSLIKDDKTYNRIFDISQNFRCYLVCCLILRKTNEFWSGVLDIDKKNAASNFKLHLARVATSIITKKTESGIADLCSLDLSTYSSIVFDNALSLLLNLIADFKNKNPSVNYINMAKTKAFSDSLTEGVRIYLS